MCTPSNMPPMCSCPHDPGRSAVGRGADPAVKWVAAVVLAAGIAWVIIAGYGAWLLLAGWLMLMGVAALVSLARDRRALEAATIALDVRSYGRDARAVPAAVAAADHADHLQAVLVHGGAPGPAGPRREVPRPARMLPRPGRR